MTPNSSKLGPVLVSLLAGLAAVPSVAAQDRATELEAEARRRFEDLHARMQKLHAVKLESDPAEAEVLSAGNRLIQERRLKVSLDGIAGLIRDARFDEALSSMAALQGDLQALLDLLLSRSTDVDSLLQEIERLEEYRDRVGDLLEEQRAEKEAAARSEALAQRLRDLEAARNAADALLTEQKSLRDEANAAGLSTEPKKAADMAAREGNLAQRAENLAERLDKLGKEGAEPSEDPASPGQKPEDGQPSDPQQGARSAKAAAGAMGQAQKQLGQNQPENALPDMDEAKRRLEQTVEEIDRMTEETKRQLMELPFEDQAEAQEATQAATDRLAQEMESDDRQKSESEDGASQTPGKRNVQQAVPEQKAAAGQLKEQKPGQARQDQQDAQEQLEKAQDELEEALSQLRQQLQDEVLRALEERFQAMLEKQRDLSTRTKAADRLAANIVTADGVVPAQVVERARALALGEHELSGEAGDALKLLQEEGTSAGFPLVVEMLRDDLTRLGERLEQAKTGRATQAIQADVEAALTDLIDALRRQIEQNEAQGGSSNDSSGQPVLVPMSAELKLVMIKQKHVNRRTVEFDEQQAGGVAGREDEASVLADQQGRVEDLLRQMAIKMAKDAQGQGR
ncbi:MAG: hypothetical protein ACO4CT_00700 [Planctomycetota bacterium]|jgi:hypothetical protein